MVAIRFVFVFYRRDYNDYNKYELIIFSFCFFMRDYNDYNKYKLIIFSFMDKNILGLLKLSKY